MLLKLILTIVTCFLTLYLITRYFQDQRKKRDLIRVPGREEEEYWRMVQVAGPKDYQDVTKVYNGHGREYGQRQK